MSIDYRIRRHPARQELLAYAETLVDRSGSLPATLGAHVAACAQCRGEVNAMRASLAFTAQAQALEPSEDLTASILLEARNIRKQQDRSRKRHSVAMTAFRGLGYAAVLALVSVSTFSLVLGNPNEASAPEQSAANVDAYTPASPEEAVATADLLEKAAEDVRALSAAVGDGPTPQTLREWEQLRAVNAMDADLSAALEALARNPGNTRAADVVQSSLRRQAETLRNLYTDRNL